MPEPNDPLGASVAAFRYLPVIPSAGSSMTSSRRQFIALAAGAVATLALGGEACAETARQERKGKHPDPRPGIDASKVLAKDELEHSEAAPVFDKVRQIPQIVDGIRCHCGCADQKDKYSLLSCFEGDGMAQHCEVCQGQASLAYRLNRLHRSLDQIRASIDAEYDT